MQMAFCCGIFSLPFLPHTVAAAAAAIYIIALAVDGIHILLEKFEIFLFLSFKGEKGIAGSF